MESLIRRQSMMYGPKPVYYDGIPLMITNVGDEPIEVSLRFNALRKTEPPIIYYNTTGKKSYKKWDLSNITLAKGGTLYLFGENSVVDSTFVVNGNSSIHLDGKLEALLQGQVGTTQFGNYALEGLFKNVTQLESVGDIMPQIIGGVNAPSSWGTGYRYSSLFENTGIVEIPNNFLKETALGNPCLGLYHRMFFGCTKLTTIPRDLFINQRGSRNYLYQSMFQNCSNLEVAADVYCQSQSFMTAHSMYRGCKKITDVKVFTKTLASNHCMQYFVADCDNLQSIDFDINRVTHWGALANAMLNCKNLTKVSIKVKTWNHEQTTTTHGAYYGWMLGVSPTGTFICTKELAEETDGYYDAEGNFVAGVGRGGDSVPAGWTIDFPIIDARGGDANAMALMAVISQQYHADGITRWVKDPSVMMKSEAEKVESISSVFNQIKQNYSFEAFQYFTLIKSIDNSYFSGSNASYLNKLTLPYSVVSINQNAFSSCTRLNLVIPENSLLKTIGNYAFRMAGSQSLYIPKLVSSISNNAFVYSSIRSFIVSDENTIYRSENHCIIKDNIIVVGGSRFDGTQSMSDTIDTIGVNAFNGRGLSKIIIPKGITTLQNSCYYSNTNAKSLYIPDSVISIANDSFNLCSKLESIEVEAANQKYEAINNTLIEKDSGTLIIGCKNSTIPSNVITLSDYCFYDCEGLETIDIPDSVTTIGIQAFDNIASLKKVTIGSGVSKINSMAFLRTNNLSKIQIKATTPPTIKTNSFTTNVIIYVPDESVEDYKAAAVWSTIASRIKPLTEYTE